MDRPPYADIIGARRNLLNGEPVLTLSWRTEIEGRRGFIHGGVIGGLLELACYEALDAEFSDVATPGFKPINVAIDYLRGATMVDIHAAAQIVRIGKRVANASAVCWQDDRSKLVATARMHLLLDR